jgi:hypothetical protein
MWTNIRRKIWIGEVEINGKGESFLTKLLSSILISIQSHWLFRIHRRFTENVLEKLMQLKNGKHWNFAAVLLTGRNPLASIWRCQYQRSSRPVY